MTDTIKSPEQIESELRACAKLGMNKSDTARAIGISFNRMNGLALKHNIDFEHRNQNRIDEYEKCAAAGMTKAATARFLGVTPNAVGHHAKRHNVIYCGSRFYVAPAPKFKRASTGSRMSCSPAAIAAYERKGAA